MQNKTAGNTLTPRTNVVPELWFELLVFDTAPLEGRRAFSRESGGGWRLWLWAWLWAWPWLWLWACHTAVKKKKSEEGVRETGSAFVLCHLSVPLGNFSSPPKTSAKWDERIDLRECGENQAGEAAGPNPQEVLVSTKCSYYL